ncbi:MAG: hypothetical protein ABSF62_00385 [Bryobacteraceae bacterium]
MPLPRHAELWFPGYVRSRLRNWAAPGPSRVWVAIADHWEPYRGKVSDEVALGHVAVWSKGWPQIAARHADSTGKPPQYTFYYPQEEYRPGILDTLAAMARQGIADVDVHIHHDGEGQQNFVDRMNGFIETLSTRHGLLRKHHGRTVFGFIHGNWALDNSRPDGRWCGLNNEITLLRDLGCYADFTMPSGASPTQSRIVNSIYWVTDDPLRPRSYDKGVPVRPGAPGSGDLLMITGPLGLRWSERLKPRMETGEIAHQDPPTAYRVRQWLRLAPRIGNNVFIKLYTHGALEQNYRALVFQGGLDRLFELLPQECRRLGHELRYVTTWEMRQAVDEAASGS